MTTIGWWGRDKPTTRYYPASAADTVRRTKPRQCRGAFSL